MRISRIIALLAATAAFVPSAASAQRYYIRQTIPGIATTAAAAAAPPVYNGTWFNTGDTTTTVCSGGTRNVNWVYACRVAGNVAPDNTQCNPATMPNPFSYSQSCSSTCNPVTSPGLVSGSGSQNISGTVAQMQASAKSYCEAINIQPQLYRSCGLKVNADGVSGVMYIAYDYSPATVVAGANTYHADCQAAN